MTGPARLVVFLGVATGIALVAMYALGETAKPPEIPKPPPLPDLPDDEIVPPPDRPGYARIQPVGEDVQPDSPGQYWLVEGNRYEVSFTIDSWIANLMGPPVIASKLEDAGVVSPQVWKLEDGWLVRGTWGNASGYPELPEDVTINKVKRIG